MSIEGGVAIIAPAVFAATALLIPLLASIAPRLRLVDTPTERKRHEGAMPTVGGLGIGITGLAALGVLVWQLPSLPAIVWPIGTGYALDGGTWA